MQLDEMEASRKRFDDALRQLEDKVLDGSQRIQDTIMSIRGPIEYARKHPMANAAVFLVGGFVLGSFFLEQISDMSGGSYEDRRDQIPLP